MKTKADLVKGWLRKAESDLANAGLCLDSKQALDTVCFHSQQAAEKYLKAYLAANEIEFPFIHNLEKLVELCAKRDPSFQTIKEIGQSLTPYAVELRYSDDFWPQIDVAKEAVESARKIKDFISKRLPPEFIQSV